MSQIPEEKLRECAENLVDKVRDTMNQCFMDMIKQGIEEKQFDHLLTLITEVRDRLNRLTPNNRRLQESLNTSIDMDLIKQELEHDAFGPTEFAALTGTVLERLRMLQSPADDIKTNQLETDLYTRANAGAKYAELVPWFLIQVNQRIDKIEADIRAFRQNATQVMMRGYNEHQKEELAKNLGKGCK
jgi:hypothetical protein